MRPIHDRAPGVSELAGEGFSELNPLIFIARIPELNFGTTIWYPQNPSLHRVSIAEKIDP
jgi:hypothetical protein